MSDDLKQILVVDDDQATLLAFKGFLMHRSLDCFTAKDGGEGLLSFVENKRKIKVAVIDFSLAVMDGFELAALIKSHNPRCYVILISGHAFNDFCEKVKKNKNIDKFFTKPFDWVEVVNVIISKL